jgi:predicted metal-binding membrane protein
MAALDVTAVARSARALPPSILAVGTMAPVSLLVLYLWSTSPAGAAMHASHATGGAALARPAVFVAAWLLMTASMMLPSAMPLLVALDRIARDKAYRHEIPLWAALAYLAVWTVVGIAAWSTSAVAATFVVPYAGTQVVAGLAGVSLAMAGVYGLSPLASACLRECRRPFGFLARYWRGGRARLQAARIGAAYGVSCVGCCVPMIGLMFVVGMANPAIMLAMGVLMVVMKTSVIGTRVSQLLSIALIGVGLAVGLGWLPFSASHH